MDIAACAEHKIKHYIVVSSLQATIINEQK